MRLKMIFFMLLLFCSTQLMAANIVYVLQISGAITPATQDYIKRGINQANAEHATAVLLRINTPGGLDSSMRGINEAILSSPIPIIAYVAPKGARAASAGTYILYASHFAVMASGTNLGAASPIQLGKEEGNSKSQSTAEKKAMNDAAAYLRSLGQLRGRSTTWSESAVRQGASLSATEAKELKIINAIADNEAELKEKLDLQAYVIKGITQQIQLKNANFKEWLPDWRYQFLLFITDPNIAYLLMLIAIYGLFFEFSTPGMILPGVIGVIALFLALYAFQLMPINYVGLSLLILGIIFMITEIFVSSLGILGIGGVIAFIIGSIMLFDTEQSLYQLDWTLIGIMSIFSLLFFAALIHLALKAHKKKVVTGKEGLLHAEGEVLSNHHGQLQVRVLGEIWEASSPIDLKPHDKIEVSGIEGLKLIVRLRSK